MENFVVEYGILFGYGIFTVALLLALVFPAIQLFSEFKKAVVGILSIVGLVGLYLLCFVLAKGEPLTLGENFYSAEQIKFVNANLFMGYISFILAVVAIGYSSISSFFK